MFWLGHVKRRLEVHAGHVAYLGAAGTHVSVRLLFVPDIPNVFVTSESSNLEVLAANTVDPTHM